MKLDAAAWRSRLSYLTATIAGMASGLPISLIEIDRVATFYLECESYSLVVVVR